VSIIFPLYCSNGSSALSHIFYPLQNLLSRFALWNLKTSLSCYKAWGITQQAFFTLHFLKWTSKMSGLTFWLRPPSRFAWKDRILWITGQRRRKVLHAEICRCFGEKPKQKPKNNLLNNAVRQPEPENSPQRKEEVQKSACKIPWLSFAENSFI